MDYFLIRLGCQDDYIKALTGGPWFIMGHSFSVRKWRPDFKPSSDEISEAAVWVRLPELPIEYFDRGVLLRIGGAIGVPLKLDISTEKQSRGRVARLCIQIDLKNHSCRRYGSVHLPRDWSMRA